MHDSPGSLQWKLARAADQLNHVRPLLHDVDLLEPGPRDTRGFIGYVQFYDWVKVPSIVKTMGLRWNDFDHHRPEQVGVIAEALLGEHPDQAVSYVLAEGGHLHLLKVPGPAGPIYEVGENGLHRTHTFALLDLPIIAAEIHVAALPARIRTSDVIGQTYQEPDQAALWRGLIHHGLLEGHMEEQAGWAGLDAEVLCPIWVAAPWMLLGADDAARSALAYDRVYPGVLGELGVPTDVLGRPYAWRRWLTAHR